MTEYDVLTERAAAPEGAPAVSDQSARKTRRGTRDQRLPGASFPPPGERAAVETDTLTRVSAWVSRVAVVLATLSVLVSTATLFFS
ncbi:MAG: hypothetical protein WD270_00870 [Acetobacterales bacterium]